MKRILYFLAFMLPYFGVVFYLALTGPDSVGRMPRWLRWAMLIYFIGGIALCGFGGLLFKAKKQEGVKEMPVEDSRITKSVRNVKRLLVLYLILFPLGLAEAFPQRELPIGLAPLALTLPVLIMIALWRWLHRLQQIEAQQQITKI